MGYVVESAVEFAFYVVEQAADTNIILLLKCTNTVCATVAVWQGEFTVSRLHPALVVQTVT